MNVGDTVLDTHSGRHGQIQKVVINHIVPGLKQAVVDFGGSLETLYFTRLKLVAKPEQPKDFDALIELLEQDD